MVGNVLSIGLRELREAVERRLRQIPNSDSLLRSFSGEDEGDEAALGRIFGEELPSGLVLQEE